ASGARRFRSTSAASALSGETYTTRAPEVSFGVNVSRSIAARNAASVFPDPVGAIKSADSPCAIAGHPSACTRVGAPSDRSNHARTGAWNRSRARVERFSTGGTLPSERLFASPAGELSCQHPVRSERGAPARILRHELAQRPRVQKELLLSD